MVFTDAAQVVGAARPAAVRVITFRVGRESYALSLTALREILPLPQLAQPPGLPPLLAGFLNLSGRAIPVVRLARLLGAAESPLGLYSPLLLLKGDNPCALIVDAAEAIATLDTATILPLREGFCVNDCGLGLAEIGGRHLMLLDPERLFLAEERRRVAELTQIEQARLASLQEATQ
jgi:purine-binding chemotaxis protein CheW